MADGEMSYARERMEEGKPTPDPTILTTEQLLREIDRLEKLMFAQVGGLKDLIEEKLSSVDSQFELWDNGRVEQSTATKCLINEKVQGLSAILDEKLISVRTQFDLIERQRVEQKKDTKDAVDAALAAAKEAVKEQTTASDRSITKSETATSEQLKQLSATFGTATAGLGDVIADVKERVGKIESMKLGALETRDDSRGSIALLVAGGSVLLTLILTIMNAIHIGH
jgi:hypothetical protein